MCCVILNQLFSRSYGDQFWAFLTYFPNISQLFLHCFPKNFPFPNYFSVISHLFLMHFLLPNNFLPFSHCYFSFLSYTSQTFLIIFLLRFLSCESPDISTIVYLFVASWCDSKIEIIISCALNVMAVPDWSHFTFFYR